jgi:4-hydroxy-4-methyl-2-oxoglutarate aldolase
MWKGLSLSLCSVVLLSACAPAERNSPAADSSTGTVKAAWELEWGKTVAAAKGKQIGGLIIDGVCRDVDEIREIGLPAYSRSAVPITARGRIMQESFNQEIQCGGVAVRPGDFVIADGSGVVFVPNAQAERVLAAAEAIDQRQKAMAAAVLAGRSVSEVMEGMGYESMLAKGEKS